ncbi:MAG: hypothetical protein WC156_04690 [Pedobacter sp.]
MRKVILLLLVVVHVVPYIACADELNSHERCSGIWAVGAKSPYTGPDFIPTKITSPNGLASINASSEGLSFVGKKAPIQLKVLINPPLTEVLWAPDSRGFTINVSDGGLVGTWEAHVYSIDQDGNPIPHNIRKLIFPITNKFLKCEPKEVANFGITAWLNGSKEILIVAEVPPHSSCRNMGAIIGFQISVKSGKIIERISEKELRKKWKSYLGCRFEAE